MVKLFKFVVFVNLCFVMEDYTGHVLAAHHPHPDNDFFLAWYPSLNLVVTGSAICLVTLLNRQNYWLAVRTSLYMFGGIAVGFVLYPILFRQSRDIEVGGMLQCLVMLGDVCNGWLLDRSCSAEE